MSGLSFPLLASLLLAACSQGNKSFFEADRKYDGPCVIETDCFSSGPMVIDAREVFTYNDLGQLVVWELDDGSNSGSVADGILEKRNTYTYYGDGRLATEEREHVFGSSPPTTVDGVIESRSVYYYDYDGKLEREEVDKGQGTDLTGVIYYTYNDADLLVLIERDGDPLDADINSWEIFEYDSAGNMITHDLADDSIDAVWFREIYTYDSDGNNTTEDIDDQADGLIDFRTSYSYDSEGNMTEAAVDGQGLMGFTPPDGIIDIRYLYTYDAAGNLSTLSVDGDPYTANSADGQPEMLWTYIYDEFGNLLYEELDGNWSFVGNTDGVPDTVTTYTYDCWADSAK